MSHDEDQTCVCVAEHRPPVLEYEEHHILPLYLGGDKDGETVWLCPTTHANAHEILRLLLKHGLASYEHIKTLSPRPVSRYAYNLARDGYLRWKMG